MSSRHRSSKPDNAPWPDDAPPPVDAIWAGETAPAKPRARASLDDIAACSAVAQQHDQPPAPDEPAPNRTPPVPAPEGPPGRPDDEIRPDPGAASHSLRKRIGPQPAAPRPPRGRRSPQDLPAPSASTPHDELHDRGPWRAGSLWALVTALVWVGALALLILGPARLAALDLPPRLVLTGGWALAALVTFLPLQLRMSLPGVTWQGVLGFSLLGYLLAFVPAPTNWLLELPDVPVYLLFFMALFYAVGAAALPLTYTLGQRFYYLRLHRHDVGRARRQAYEVALLAVATFVLAGLRVLTPISFGLLALVLVLTEALLLSQVQPEG